MIFTKKSIHMFAENNDSCVHYAIISKQLSL